MEMGQNQSNTASKRNICDHRHTINRIDVAVKHSSTRAHIYRLTSQVPVSTQTHHTLIHIHKQPSRHSLESQHAPALRMPGDDGTVSVRVADFKSPC